MENLLATKCHKSKRKVILKYTAELAVHGAIISEGLVALQGASLPTGWVTLPYKDIADITGLSKSQISRAIKKLDSHGFIAKAELFDSNGRRMQNIFGIKKAQSGRRMPWAENIKMDIFAAWAQENGYELCRPSVYKTAVDLAAAQLFEENPGLFNANQRGGTQ